MIILPSGYTPKLLKQIKRSEWLVPSEAQPKDAFGRENNTRFRVTARLHDNHIVWCGWFEDRDDADAFLWAIVSGSIQHERELWRLPTPNWHFDLVNLNYQFASVTFLTTPTGSNQSFTSSLDWNNSSNSIQTFGAGGGGAFGSDGDNNYATGGGGGAWNKILGFVFATPGTTTATYQIGTGGARLNPTDDVTSINGNVGGDTWFNGTTLGGSSVGSKGGGGGLQGHSFPASGALGGSGASGIGTSSNNGGDAGAIAATVATSSSGGGGAAGPNGAGNAGVTSDANPSDGGSADAGFGGAGGIANIGGDGGAGGDGNEFDASHGAGGGGAGGRRRVGVPHNAGDAGNYGGGGGGLGGTDATTHSGAGMSGMIILMSTPFLSFQVLGQLTPNPPPQRGGGASPT